MYITKKKILEVGLILYSNTYVYRADLKMKRSSNVHPKMDIYCDRNMDHPVCVIARLHEPILSPYIHNRQLVLCPYIHKQHNKDKTTTDNQRKSER